MRPIQQTRVRLALGATAVFVLIAAAAAAAIWLAFSRLQYASLDSTLTSQAQVLVGGLQDTNGVISFAGGETIPNETAGGIGVGVLLFDSGGHVVTQSGTVPPAASVAGYVRGVSGGAQPVTSTVGSGANAQRVLVEVMPSSSGFSGVLVISRPTRELDQTLWLVGVLLGSVAAGLTLIVGVLTYLLAGRALRPVRTMTETLQQFTADAAHELRGPLALMRTELEVSLTRPRSSDEYRASEDVVLREVERLSVLADELLTLARADAGALQLQLQSVDVGDLVDETAARWQPLAQSAGVSLKSDVISDRTLRADPVLLRRLVDNLVDNAIRHTPPSGRVAISVDGTDGVCTLVVADTGPGIPEDQRTTLFDRFTRGDSARGHDTGGAGLGLALCRVIAQLHGGSIALDDTRSGASFRVTLPVRA
jgi:signal transduction histidine kinase